MNTVFSSRPTHVLKHGHRALLVTGLLALIMVCSAFSFAPSAHAASRQALSVAPECSFALITSHNNGADTVNLWQNSCNGGTHAELIAHESAKFTLTLWGNSSCSGASLQSITKTLSNGGVMNTSEFLINGGVCAQGKIV